MMRADSDATWLRGSIAPTAATTTTSPTIVPTAMNTHFMPKYYRQPPNWGNHAGCHPERGEGSLRMERDPSSLRSSG